MKYLSLLWSRLGSGSATRMITLSLLIAIFTRTFNLNWGAPWYFHPDERNIASAVTRIHEQEAQRLVDYLDPHFYAYGTVPIYLTYVVATVVKESVAPDMDFFAIAIIIGRIWSALLGIALVAILASSARFWGDKKYAAWVALFASCNVGFIQFAHYGTFEIWLTMFYWLVFIVSLQIAIKPRRRDMVLAGLLLGLAVGTKVTSVIFFPLIYLAYIAAICKKRTLKAFFIYHLHMVGVVILAMCIYMITNPYALSSGIRNGHWVKVSRTLQISETSPWFGFTDLFNMEFVHSMNVEGDIARGEISVFYTRHFHDAIPLVYEIIHVFPWILSVPFLLLSLWGFFMLGYRGIKKRHIPSLLLLAFVVLQCGFSLNLYVHWTRYVIPLLPAFIIAGAYAIDRVHRLLVLLHTIVHAHASSNGKTTLSLAKFGLWTLVGYHLLYTFLVFIPYFADDPRMAAAKWLSAYLPATTPIVSEVYDLGIVPFNPFFRHITLFNFYELDQPELTEQKKEELQTDMDKADVFIVLSRRIWKNSLDQPSTYPLAAHFYEDLFEGSLGFTKIKEFTNYPRFGPLVLKDESLAEETFSVFDRPRIQIWIRPELSSYFAKHE